MCRIKFDAAMANGNFMQFLQNFDFTCFKEKFHSVYCGNFHMFSLLKCFLIYFNYFVRDFGTVVYGKDFFLL